MESLLLLAGHALEKYETSSQESSNDVDEVADLDVEQSVSDQFEASIEFDATPSNVVSFETAAQERAATVDQSSSSGEEATDDDPFAPFVDILWMIETGDHKKARERLGVLKLDSNPQVRRMANELLNNIVLDDEPDELPHGF